jgi:hypothetical protein
MAAFFIDLGGSPGDRQLVRSGPALLSERRFGRPESMRILLRAGGLEAERPASFRIFKSVARAYMKRWQVPVAQQDRATVS